MRKIIFIILIGLGIMACENNQTRNKEKDTSVNLKVFAVNYPLAYFAERIGGEYIDVIYPIPADVDPAYWVPYQALEEIQNADLILDNGANYAKWMEKVSLPASKVINTSQAFSDEYIKIQEGTTHSHGGDGEHVHHGYAFTTWLDFKIAAGQAKSIMEALVSRRPQHKDIFTANFKKLESELLALDNEMNSIADELPEIPIFASHPVYQYLGEAYGLTIISEHWEPGEKPTETQWNEFQHNLEHNPANLMLWEGMPSEETKAKLQKSKVQSILFSPCANTPDKGDFMTTMKQSIANLKRYVEEAC